MSCSLNYQYLQSPLQNCLEFFSCYFDPLERKKIIKPKNFSIQTPPHHIRSQKQPSKQLQVFYQFSMNSKNFI